ncbi:MAG: FkbM family methyltransferase [Mycobacterium sp.]
MTRRVTAFGEIRDAVVGQGLRTLARATPWVETELVGIAQVVRPGNVCIDVGAAAGFYTAELARLVGAEGLVYSLEPLRFAHATSSAALGLRSAQNVRRHAVALGTNPGEQVMSVPLRNGKPVTGRSFVDAGADGLGSNAEFDEHIRVVVDTETLDAFCQRLNITRIDFVKIDVEGAELDVLVSGEKTIARTRPAMMLEVEDRHMARFGRTAEDIVAWFTERDYRMSVWSADSWRPVDKVTDTFRNYLFQPR